MIIIKSDPEVDLMRQAGRITAGARTVARQMVEPGVTTRQINREVHKFITKSGASPCFMTDGGFPTAACISVNDEIIYGVPGDRVLHDRDIVSVDVGSTYKGYVSDAARTYAVGEISKEAQEDTEEIEVVLADRNEVKRILKEERVAIMCAYMLMHFLKDKEPFAFLEE